MTFETKRELLIVRPCACGCGTPVTPNPRAMIARNAKLYYADSHRMKCQLQREAKKRADAKKTLQIPAVPRLP